jgi:hypothetical protein
MTISFRYFPAACYHTSATEYLFYEKEVFIMQDPMRLPMQPDIWANYDPEKVREGLRKSASALQGVDIAALKRDIRDQRGQDSHGRPTE